MTKDFFDELDNELTQTNAPKQEPKHTQTASIPKKAEEVSDTSKPENKGQNRPKSEGFKTKNFKKQQRPFGQKVVKSSVDEESSTEDENDNDFDMIKYSNDDNYNFQKNILANFPQTKFYMPTLRDGYTRVIPIGGNNETGSKNMNMVQYGEEILIIDAGVQFAEPDMLGASYSIPDISSLMRYKQNIKGLVITHADLDHIGALKHILPALGMPPLYGTKLTLGIIKKALEEHNLTGITTFVEVDPESEVPVKIGTHFDVEFFRVNHSVPDCA